MSLLDTSTEPEDAELDEVFWLVEAGTEVALGTMDEVADAAADVDVLARASFKYLRLVNKMANYTMNAVQPLV